MKTLMLAMFLGASSALLVQAQRNGDAAITYALNGPVHTFRTETATVVVKDGQPVEGPRIVQLSAEFNRDGNRTDFRMYDAKGALVRRIVSKFDGPRMTEYSNFDGAGNMWLRGTWDYDAEGRIKQKATYNGDKSLRSKTVYTRNEVGQVLEWVEFGANEVALDKMTNTFTSSGALNTSEREQRDPNGVLVVKEFHDVPHKQVEIVNYKPDGSVLSKSVHVDQQISDYSEDGSLRRSTTISDPGRLPSSVTVDASGNRKRESQIPDEIDSQGNWTKKTNWVTDASGTKATTVTYRVITYYEK